MNSKDLQKLESERCNSKANCGNPEVLVLPPNILYKLGIDFGNIQSSKENSIKKKCLEEDCVGTNNSSIVQSVDTHRESNSNNESSILETANLMKESVLLSPTFNSLKSHPISNELEKDILNKNEYFVKEQVTEPLNDVGIDEDGGKINNGKRDVSKITELTNKGNTMVHDILDSVDVTNSESMLKSSNKAQDHIIFNKTVKISISDSLEKVANSKDIEPKSKINIISQEIIGVDKINELKYLATHHSNHFLPVKIDTLLDNSKLNSNTESSRLNSLDTDKYFKKPKTLNSAKVTNGINKKDKNSVVNIKLKPESIEVRNKSDLKESDSKMHLIKNEGQNLKDDNKLKSSQKLSQHVVSKSLIANHEQMQNDKCIHKIQKTATVFIEADKKLLDRCISNVNRIEDSMDKKISSDENIVTSKLCIQGVEKPGGDTNFSYRNVKRTYSRHKRLNSKNLGSEDPNAPKTAKNIKVNLDYKIDNAQSYSEENVQNFCICRDFGSFTYYEENESYQHIHFWRPKKVSCSLQILFSIYENENVIADKNNDIVIGTENMLLEILDDEVNELDEYCHYNPISNIICNDIEIENVHKHTNFSSTVNSAQSIAQIYQQNENSFPIIHKNLENNKNNSKDNGAADNVKNNNCNKTSNKDDSRNEYSNRHNVLNTNISHQENIEKQMEESSDQNFTYTKKTNKRKRSPDQLKHNSKKVLEFIKCAICKTKVTTNIEWEDHICKEHDFVAWKEGEAIDLGDKNLLNKLKKRLRDTEKLVCTFCDNQICHVQEFVDHVSICMNRRVTRDPKVCGVCHTEIDENLWIAHICKEHNYLAWESGEPPLDLTDEQIVCSYLNITSQTIGGLECSNCGIKRKSARSFIYHLKTCANIEIFPSEQQRALMDDTECYVTCGVCHIELESDKWLTHISLEHKYLAWKEGEIPLDIYDTNKVKEHLQVMSKENGGLTCNKCGCRRRYVKSFLTHVENCDGSKDSTNNETLNESSGSVLNFSSQTLNELSSEKLCNSDDDEGVVECGVCHLQVTRNSWLHHIQEKHAYLAWKEGEKPININDPDKLKEHLYILSKENDGLVCGKCGCRRKYVKSYLSHIQKCDGTTDSTMNETLNNSNALEQTLNESAIENLDNNNDEDNEVMVECGVCHQQMEGKFWENHIQKHHSYLAWKEGRTPLDFNIEENVFNHLNEISKKYNGLKCNKCGLTRKYVKVFLAHIKTCESNFEDFNEVPITREDCGEDYCQCGVCAKVVDKKDWKSHAMKKHYNVAWVVGDYPIDVKNPNVVEKYLREYKNVYKKLACSLCGITRASNLGFYAHIIQCGKTEEEIDMYRNYCDLCNNKYLCIYKNQHTAMHREQEFSKERKLSSEAKMSIEIKEEFLPGEGRMAAKKARNMLEKYSSYEYKCDTCGYGVDEEKDLEYHTCKKKNKDSSDSEVSVKLEESSSDDSDESGVVSSASDEEVRIEKKKKHGESVSAASRVKRIPFDIRNAKVYLQQTAGEFHETYHTNKTLFPHWLKCVYKIIGDDLISKYMPPLEESCKLSTSKSDWATLKKFEAVKQISGYTVFVGSSIQCVSWAPPRKDDRDDVLGHYLAVSCHNSDDLPRLDRDVTYQNANMLQIWDFGDLKTSVPMLGLGIAHDYGTVWSFDWCPSGVREAFTESDPFKEFKRLGLLAIACSNGSAYILCVPYPFTITTSAKLIYELTPVAELRLGGRERKKCQATSISWCSENGHSTVMVGYSDGTTALYDLQSESPLLKYKEDSMSIYYPYHDERPHNTTVTGVTTFPLKYSACGLLVSSTSPTGADSTRRGACGGPRLRSLQPSSAASYLPHWPTALLAENDTIVNSAVNELDWWCVGRRLGAVHSCSSCLRCGMVAAYAPPVLRIMKSHPVYSELDKEPIAIIQMISTAKKRSKHKNDDLAMKLEPLTYADAIKSYGIEFKYARELDKRQFQNINYEQYPERFPLSDVPSIAYNLSQRHHKKLALATHAGFVFIINT